MNILKDGVHHLTDKSHFLNNISLAAVNSILISILSNVIMNIGSGWGVMITFFLILFVNYIFLQYTTLKELTESAAKHRIEIEEKENGGGNNKKLSEEEIQTIFDDCYNEEKFKTRFYFIVASAITVLAIVLMIKANISKNDDENILIKKISQLDKHVNSLSKTIEIQNIILNKNIANINLISKQYDSLIKESFRKSSHKY